MTNTLVAKPNLVTRLINAFRQPATTLSHASGTRVSIAADGSLSIECAGDIRFRSQGDIWLNGRRVLLNCDEDWEQKREMIQSDVAPCSCCSGEHHSCV